MATPTVRIQVGAARGATGGQGPVGPAGTAAANSGLDTTASGTTSARLWRIDPGNMSGGTAGDVDYFESLQALPGQNTPSGLTPADNYVIHRWWNGEGGAKVVSSRSAMGHSEEWAYALNLVGPIVHEWHYQGITAGGAAVRLLSFVAAHDGTRHAGTLALDSFTVRGNATKPAQNGREFIVNIEQAVISMAGLFILKGENGTAAMKQFNAAGTVQELLPHIGTDNSLIISQPMTVNAAMIPLELLGGARAGVAMQFSGANPDSRLLYALVTNTVTGSMWSRQFQLSCTGTITDEIEQQHASGKLVSKLTTGGGSAGLHLAVSGKDAVVAVDAANDRIVIAAGSSIEPASPAFSIARASGVASFGATMRLKAYTVAGLPTPTSALQEGQAFASNGRKSGEGGGAGTGVPVWCDGAAWRTFYDNAAVAA